MPPSCLSQEQSSAGSNPRRIIRKLMIKVVDEGLVSKRRGKPESLTQLTPALCNYDGKLLRKIVKSETSEIAEK